MSIGEIGLISIVVTGALLYIIVYSFKKIRILKSNNPCSDCPYSSICRKKK